MLDYPPESMFDDFILQEENECLLERIEDPDLEKLICRKIARLVMESIEKYKQGKATDVPAAFVGGYDSDSNTFAYVDYSQTPPEKIHEQLQEIVDIKVEENKIAPVGQTKIDKETNKESNTTGRCAEFHVVNKMLKLAHKKDNIRLTKAVRPKKKYKHREIKTESVDSLINSINSWEDLLKVCNLREIPYCSNCETMFRDINILEEE